MSSSAIYAAAVVAQSTDGTLSLIPDDARLWGLGLSRVPVRYGLSGSTAQIPAGSRCRVAFDDGAAGLAQLLGSGPGRDPLARHREEAAHG